MKRFSHILQLLGAIAIAVAWLIPNHYPPWTSFYNDLCMAVGLVLIALGLGRLADASGPPSLVLAVLGLAAIPWIQYGTGLLSFSGDAWITTLYLSGFATAIFVGYRWTRVDASTFAATLSVAVVFAAFASSLLALSQVLGVFPIGRWGVEITRGARPGADLAQSNNLATLLAFGMLGLLLLLEQRRIGKAVATALLVVLVAGLAVTQSRVALLFGPLIWFGLVWKQSQVKFSTRPREVGVAVFAASILLWIEPHLLPSGEILAGQSVAGRGVQSLRFQVWPVLFDGLSSHPWVGYGWLQVSAAELAAADRHAPVGELWAQGHNLFVELLVWCGYPLGLFLGVAAVYWFVTRSKRARSVESVIAMLFIAIVGAHSMTEFPYQYAYFLIPMGLWIGLVEASIGSRSVLSTKAYPAIVFASFTLLVAICWDYPAIEDDFRLVRFESRKIGSVHATQAAPEAPFLSAQTAFLRVARMSPHVGMSSAELDLMGEVVRRFPFAAGMSNYATALALNGRPDDARTMFTKILHIHGPDTYAIVKKSLHEAALEGPPPLRVLEMTVPPW